MKFHSPAGYALGIAGAAIVVYMLPPKMRFPVAALAIAGGLLVARGGIEGIKQSFGGTSGA